MQASHKLNQEQATQLFWDLQRQWNGMAPTRKYTVADANKCIRSILTSPKTSKALRRQASNLQSAIISNKRGRKSTKQQSNVLQLSFQF